MSDRRPLRVGIIGVGNIAANHARGYQAAGARIVALADPASAALARRAVEWGVERTFADHRQLLAMAELDAVSICTPNALHGPMTLAAAAAGKHVLCEKPVSLSLAEGAAMVDACARASVVFQVNHHLRANRSVRRVRELLDAGTLGRITYIRLRQAHDWGGAEEVPPTFRTAALAGGGTLLDNGCHLFDLAGHLGGPVADVFARTATLKFDTRVDDTATASLRFASGALGHVETQWTATGWEMSFGVFGTRGALEYTDRTGRPVLRWTHRDGGNATWAEPEVTAWEGGGGSDHSRAIDAFVAAVEGRGPVICSGADGLDAVRLALAAYESAEAGRPVTIEPLMTEPVAVDGGGHDGRIRRR